MAPRDGGVGLLRVLEQGLEELLHGGVAPVGLSLERAVHHGGELGGHVGGARDERLDLLGEDLAEDDRAGDALVGAVIREHLVHHRAHGPDVAAVIGRRLARGLLRRHVHGRADHAPREGGALARRDLGDAEIDELGRGTPSLPASSARQEDVLGLDVPVHDARAVRRRERAHDGHQDLDRLRRREPVPPHHAIAQRLAVEQLLHDVRRSVVPLPDLEHRHDVGVMGHRRGPRLAPEARQHLRPLRQVRVEHLERDAPPDPGVLRLEDDAHAALADAAQQRELAADHHARPQGARVDLPCGSWPCHVERQSKAKRPVASTRQRTLALPHDIVHDSPDPGMLPPIPTLRFSTMGPRAAPVAVCSAALVALAACTPPPAPAAEPAPSPPPADPCAALAPPLHTLRELSALVALGRSAPIRPRRADRFLAELDTQSAQALSAKPADAELAKLAAETAARLSKIAGAARAFAAKRTPDDAEAARVALLEEMERGELPVQQGASLCHTGEALAGQLPAAALRRVVRGGFASFVACYEPALRRDPTLRGTLRVRFVVARDGSVSDAIDADAGPPDPLAWSLTENDAPLRSPEVSACVTAAFRKLAFPKPEGGTFSGVYPIELGGAEGCRLPRSVS